MFTGIITNTGLIVLSQRHRLAIKTKKKFTGVVRGESVAVNGCCLTVALSRKNFLSFDVSAETRRKTALSSYRHGMVVNLERSLKAGDRLGGHFVLGHVDGIGKIKGIKRLKGSCRVTITYPKKFSKLLIEKGSVAVDGISLTVCNLTKAQFDVHIIPHTWKNTNLKGLQRASSVNLEFDVLGKYARTL